MRALRSGTKVVLLFGVFAAFAFAIFRIYGERVMSDQPPDTPFHAARAFVQADNTVVGLVGAIREVRPITVRAVNASSTRSPRALAAGAVSAVVVGARDSGRLYADLEAADARWTVIRAAFVLSSGERLPLAGERPPALEAEAVPVRH